MTELELLQHKLDTLLKQHQALKGQVLQLQKENSKKEKSIVEQYKIIEQLNKELQIKTVAGAANTTEATEKLKQHIEQVIKVIDSNLALLK